GFARSGDEFINEFVISSTGQTSLAHADIIGIVQQLLVVGADVQHHRQAVLRMYAGAGGIKREFADRNAHAVGAKVAETENALAVGDDDKPGWIAPVAHELGDTPAIVGCDEHAAR